MSAIAREWLNARPVAWATFNQRHSILSSWFKYALRNEIADIQSNPIERIKPQKQGEKKEAAQPLRPGTVKAALAKIDRSTVEGLRNYALLSAALTLGHRATAAVNLAHQKGVALEQVRQFLGHKNAKTTSDYLRE